MICMKKLIMETKFCLKEIFVYLTLIFSYVKINLYLCCGLFFYKKRVFAMNEGSEVKNGNGEQEKNGSAAINQSINQSINQVDYILLKMKI